MCGLAGMFAFNGGKVDPSVIRRMSESIKHRGPDEEGEYISGSIGIGFRRLSIIDLSLASHQPMLSEDGQKIIAFNGEIYNYLELRQELQKLGHVFISTGDTEVLLHAYCEWGYSCLDKLNGMWAFIIYDLKQKKLFGSRDRFGIKPLYYYKLPYCILFASEIKAILASGHYRETQNWKVISKFLLLNHLDDSTETFYSKIEQIPPGSAFEIDLEGRLNIWCYWSIEQLPNNINLEDPVHCFREIFEDAVRIRLRSDVPIGVCLSGGLDSTSIMCTMANLINQSKKTVDDPIQAFCFIDDEFDESPFITDTLDQTSAQLNQLQTNPYQLWENLSQILWYHDEPVHSMTALIGFELFKLASTKGVKVILNGQGADETIAGYLHYFRNYWYTLLSEEKVSKALCEIKAYCNKRGGSWLVFFWNSLRCLYMSQLWYISAYRKLGLVRQYRTVQNNPWFTPQLSSYLQMDGLGHIDQGLDTALKNSVEVRSLPLYLRVEDRNSMAHSVEARLPFLDYRLVSLVFNLPARWKMRGPWNKYILREAMRGCIPESVRCRLDKMGFPTPQKRWIETLYQPIRDTIESQKFRERGIYNVSMIRKDLELHRRGIIDVANKLFNVIQFEIWLKNNKF